MQKGFYNEEQQAFIDKLKATFTKEELRLLPQTFEQWTEDSDYELQTYYEVCEVHNMNIDYPTFLAYNHMMTIYMTNEELQELNEARAEEVSKLDSDVHFDPFDGTHPTNPELRNQQDHIEKDEDLPY
jgi:hypothetical protein